MRKIVIIEHEPLTHRLKEIWNIEKLKANNIHVEYWDISQLVFKNIDIPEIVNDNCVKRLSLIKDFERLLMAFDIPNTVFVVELFPNWANRRIFYLLKKYKCFCVKIDLYANTNLPSTLLDNVHSLFCMSFFRKGYSKLRWLVYKKIFLSNIYSKNLSSSVNVNPDFSINHPDYEKFRYDETTPVIKDLSYILFIDTYYPLHPDFHGDTGMNYANVEEYRSLMRRFFDFVEKKYTLPVIIAAHPKAIYIGGEYGERKIIKGNTCNLVKFANLIITHESNSLSFIALSNKPFAIVYPDSYKLMNYLLTYINNLAGHCGKKAYNLDVCDWNSIEFSCLNEKYRNHYIYSYLTSPLIENERNIDIWIESLLAD